MLNRSQHQRPFRPQRRRAAILTEVLVAAVLLSAGVAVVARTHSSLRRLWTDTRHCQLATDELCNQILRLQQMPADSVEAALHDLVVDAAVAEVLPAARLEAELFNDEMGRRVRLSINWQRAGQPDPLVLVGWLAHATQDSTELQSTELESTASNSKEQPQ